MDKTYNTYNIEASFKNYLLAVNANDSSHSINIRRNSARYYLSDIRHFFGWLESMKISRSQAPSLEVSTLEQYRDYLIDSTIPTATINRRLSTLRKFYAFCISQGLSTHNPAKKIINLIEEKTDSINLESNMLADIDQVLSEFSTDLGKTKNTKKDIIISDIKEFLIINSGL